MPKPAETKHQRFTRLMTRRMNRALEELRLVSQLASDNYENTPQEAEVVIRFLDESVNKIATAFDVPYVTAIGDYALRIRESGFGKAKPVIDEIEIAKVIDLLNQNKPQEAKFLLKEALLKEVA